MNYAMILISIRNACVMSALMLAVTSLEAQLPGSLDPTFNPNDPGNFLGDGAHGGPVEAMVAQPDGKLIIVGGFGLYNGTIRQRVARLNTDGTLDASFNSLPGANGDVRAVAMQADGKVLIGGAFQNYAGVAHKCIVRLNADGSLDTTFDPGTGFSTGSTNFANVNAFAVQPNGKIIVAGDFTEYNGTPRTDIIRLNADGSIDPTFDPGTGTGQFGTLYAVVVASDGKILIGGSFETYNGTTRNGLARLTPGGGLDNLFDPGTGVGDFGMLRCIVERADGKIYIGGNFTEFNGINRQKTARLNLDGSVDLTYDSSIGPDVLGIIDNVRSLVEQADGSLLIGGTFTMFGGVARPYIARLTDTGALDATYATGAGPGGPIHSIVARPDGKAVIAGSFYSVDGTYAMGVTLLGASGTRDNSFNPGSGFNANDVDEFHVHTDGRILVRGRFLGYNGITRRTLAQMMPDGELDSSFDPGIGPGGGLPLGMAVQPDGQIVIAGHFTSYAGVPRNRIARLNTDGTLDGTLDPDGGADSWVHCVALQPDGKILIGGIFSAYNGTPRARIARLNADGSLDTTFDPGAGADNTVSAILPLPDGTVLISGSFNTFNGVPRYRIARLLTDGSLDPSFDPGGGANGAIRKMYLMPDGRLMILGPFSTNDAVTRIGIARLEADGSLDPSFHAGAPPGTTVNGLALYADGRMIVTGGPGMSFGGVLRPGIARLLPDGALDLSFAPTTGTDVSMAPVVLLDDLRLLAGGNFSTYEGVGRNRIARIFHGLSVGSGPLPSHHAPVLFPNPTDGLLSVRMDGTAFTHGRLRVVAVDGRVVLEQRINGPNTVLDVQHVAAGTYTVELIDTQQQRMMQRFIKQ